LKKTSPESKQFRKKGTEDLSSYSFLKILSLKMVDFLTSSPVSNHMVTEVLSSSIPKELLSVQMQLKIADVTWF